MVSREALIALMGKQEAIDYAMEIVKIGKKFGKNACNLPNMLPSFLLYCTYVCN